MLKQSPNWQETVRSYFTISRSQRRALVVCIVIMLLYGGWYMYTMQQLSRKMANVPFIAVEVRKELVALDTSAFNNAPYAGRTYGGATFSGQPNYDRTESAMDANTLHPFDPNTAAEAELLAMGLRTGLVKTLLNYRSKGGKFRHPADLSKLYGLRSGEADILMPFIAIETEAPVSTTAPTVWASEKVYTSGGNRGGNPVPVVDINRVDSFSLRMLPAIGEKRAALIIKYRNNLGGFINVEQIREVYGINDSVFAAIKPYIQLDKEAIRPINLNTATEDQLKLHPYIKYKLAGIIISYRKQHGAFKSVDDLLKIYIIKPEWLERVRPYLVVE